MSIKLIKDALQWNEHPNKTEQAGRTTRHNEYDAGTEIEKKKARQNYSERQFFTYMGKLRGFSGIDKRRY
jgi:hypothetical protein